MKTALEHRLVADYLRRLDYALGSLDEGAAAELSGQLRAHIVDALAPDTSDEEVAEVLASLGPPAMVAAEAGPPWPERSRPRQSLRRRIATRARRTSLRAWLVIVSIAAAVCVAAGTFIFWAVQPSLSSYGNPYAWWYSIDASRNVTTRAAGATQDTIPLRPGQLQGIAILIYNPSDVTQRILGTPGISGTPYFMGFLATPVPPQIAVAITMPANFFSEPQEVRYRVGGAIPPHSYRWVRVLWRSWHCLSNEAGASFGTNELTVRVQLGWITRTENIQLPTQFTLSITKANLDAAYCQAHGGGFQPQP
jgi:hypothetical protein